MPTAHHAIENTLLGRHTIGTPRPVTGSHTVTAAPITRADGYRYGWQLTCTGCGTTERRGRHTTVFAEDIPAMFAANHTHCDRPTLH